MNIVIIDNYDSFTYNLVSTLEELGYDRPKVLRNDRFELEDLAEYSHIILSPGPGIPEEAGLLKAVIQRYATEKPILGICLGMQAIGEVFGGQLRNLDKVFHGISTPIHQTGTSTPVFQDLPTTFDAGRYHSWVIDPAELPETLEVTCKDAAGEIMGIAHREYPVHGLQFHPESVMTELGPKMIQNFLTCTGDAIVPQNEQKS